MTPRPKHPRCNDRLPPTFYHGTPEEVAQRLLGQLLVRAWPDGGIASGIIVEVEAYLSSDDPASHSCGGLRKRNASMFEAAGTLYVYTIHTRCCLNIVTEAKGLGSAVLIRAIEPYEGVSRMLQQAVEDQRSRGAEAGESPGPRHTDREPVTGLSLAIRRLLTSGPGRLCRSLSVRLDLDGENLTTSHNIWLEEAPAEVQQRSWKPLATPRIGISKGTEIPLRWIIDGNQFVSGLAREHSQGRKWRFLP